MRGEGEIQVSVGAILTLLLQRSEWTIVSLRDFSLRIEFQIFIWRQ
jgi:hypothetical protein